MIRDYLTSAISAACPWLALVMCLQYAAKWRGGSVGDRGLPLLLSGAIALAVLLIPVEGLAIGRWIAGVNANFSIPLTGMLAVAVSERVSSRQLFSRREWAACWIFGAAASLVLYPLALGVSSVDPYEWGWRFSPLFVVMAMVSGWLIWEQNRFGFLLVVAAIAFQLRAFESSNYWDYLLDPIYGVVSIVVLLRGALTAGRMTGRNALKSYRDGSTGSPF